jgi:GMP synthase (glutamine-hydrolysing)
MNVCCLEHASFEGPGSIVAWADERGHDVRTVRLYRDEPLPSVEEVDLLVVMGGPMSVRDEAAYPWLMAERRLIARCLAGGHFVFGVCLGSQLLAESLGARVYRNRFKEVGWLPLKQVSPHSSSHLLGQLPREFTAFHWHGETYDLPSGTTHVARSEGCSIQAFEHPYALGLQFHLEITPDGIACLIRECASEIGSGPYEQTRDQMLAGTDQCRANSELLARILNGIEAKIEYASRLGV